MLQVLCGISQKWLLLESKLKLEVKTIGQELQNEVLYIFVAQILLEIQQNLWKYEFSNFCIFVKMAKLLYKITKIEKYQKDYTFSFNHNFKSIWAIDTYNTSYQSSWPTVLTTSFDSRSNYFWHMPQNTSSIFHASPFILL